MKSKSYDIIEDFNPRTWLSKYRQTSISYLIKMAFFYYVIGVLLQIFGNLVIQHAISGYVGPSLPYSLSIGLVSGPLEETLFFGLPFYWSGNPHLILATGIAWSVGHIFSTDVFALTNLAFGNFMFTIPLIFFSIRTWSSGKGWFAVVFHSAWNVAFLGSQCVSGKSCLLIGSDWYFVADVISIIGAGLLVMATYRLYKRKSIESR